MSRYVNDLRLFGYQAKGLRLEQIASAVDLLSQTDGVIAYLTPNGNKRIAFWDGQLAALVTVPRLDRAEAVTSQWSFSPGATSPPFALGANAYDQLVARFNADLLDGAHAAAAATASTIPVRDASGRMKAATPAAADDVATRQYVLDTVYGITSAWQEVRVKATGNVNVSSAPAANNSVWDGPTLSNGDRVLLASQATASQNGLYVYNGSGAAMTRTADADQDAEVLTGKTVAILEGTQFAGTQWQLTTPAPITVGTTALTFVYIGGGAVFSAGPGIGRNANEVYVKLGAAGSPAGYAYTSGALVFCSGANTLDMTGGLHWDAAQSRLGFGTTSPARKLDVRSGAVRISQASASGDELVFADHANVEKWTLFIDGSDLVVKRMGVDEAMRFTDATTVKVPSLTASRFVTTDANKVLASFDLFGSNNAFTGANTFQNAVGTVLNATAAAGNSVNGQTNWLRSAKNTISAFIGDSDNTSAYGVNEWNGALRFNGTAVGFGDLAFFPKGGGAADAGHFRLSTSVGTLGSTPNAKLGVGDLYLANVSASSLIQTNANKTLVSSNVLPSSASLAGGTQGGVLFCGVSGVFAQDPAVFFWDAANDRLGLGTAAPAARLHVPGLAWLPGLISGNTEEDEDWPMPGAFAGNMLTNLSDAQGTFAATVTGGAAVTGGANVYKPGAGRYRDFCTLSTSGTSGTAVFTWDNVVLDVPGHSAYAPFIVARNLASVPPITNIQVEYKDTAGVWQVIVNGAPVWIRNVWRGAYANFSGFPIKGVRVTLSISASQPAFYLAEIGLWNKNMVLGHGLFGVKNQANVWSAAQTFAAAPLFSTLTANHFLKLDGAKAATSFDLFGAANTWTQLQTFSGGFALGGLTQGSLLFVGSGGALAQDNTRLFYDNAGKKLGIGTGAPEDGLDCATNLLMRRASEATSGNPLIGSHPIKLQSSYWSGSEQRRSMFIMAKPASGGFYRLLVEDHDGVERFSLRNDGLVTLPALTPNALIQTNASSQLTASLGLPAGLTMGGEKIARLKAVSVGNGSSTSYAITHNLGTYDVSVEVFDDTASVKDTVLGYEVERNSINQITLKFGAAPATNQMRVLLTA